MKNTESQENYLETILILSQKKSAVRCVDIASELEFTEASVSVAMRKLREKELITVSLEGYIMLTENGKKIASAIYERHETIMRFLVWLGVDATTAEKDACKIEHIISKKTFYAIKKFEEKTNGAS